jgi:sulfhydrogenase subunit alpha
LKKRVKVESLARVEGEGGFLIEIKDGKIAKLHMNIFEAPRFFESFIRGRPFSDVMDFTARICGICPVAYQMSSVHAIEKIFGITVPEPIRKLRRLMYCGEWIESHALHVYLLHGPDFYGIESAWGSKEYLEIAKKGLRLKQVGNNILTILGGRPIHPVSVRVGGFYKIPDRRSLELIVPDLDKAYEESLASLQWASALPFSSNSPDMEYVALHHPYEYPMNEGNVISSRGLDATCDDFFASIEEYQVDYSTALHSGIRRDGQTTPYMVGPLSRLNLNHEQLPPEIRNAIKESGISLPLKNTQMSVIARSIEISYAFYEAIRIIRDYEEPERPYVECGPQPGEAVWITEAPRGILIHRYELDGKGYVRNCSIIPPTSQNLGQIEKDIYHFVQNNAGRQPEYIRRETEKIVRSYDPCISCSAHVLVLKEK